MINPVVHEADGPVDALEDGAVAPLEVNGLTVGKSVDDSTFERVSVVPVESTPARRLVLFPAADIAVAVYHGLCPLNQRCKRVENP